MPLRNILLPKEPQTQYQMNRQHGLENRPGNSRKRGRSVFNVKTVHYYPMAIEFEKNFDVDAAFRFAEFLTPHILTISALYLLSIYLGVNYMKNRDPVEFKWSLFAWNLSLALISIAGSTRLVPGLIYTLKEKGLEYSICRAQPEDYEPVLCFSGFVFCNLKLLELFDTAFLVMGKKRLIFLHWFHHCSVLTLTSYGVVDRVPMGRWFGTLNFLVHSLMYSYYAVRSLKIHVPRTVSMSITVMQIIQMVMGALIALAVLVKWMSGADCSVTRRTLIIGTSLYSVYLGLFVKYFIDAYVRPRWTKTRKEKQF